MTVHSSNLVCETCAVTAAVKEKRSRKFRPKSFRSNPAQTSDGIQRSYLYYFFTFKVHENTVVNTMA